MNSTWLPLLRDLNHTIAVLDREESALQQAEEEAAVAASAAEVVKTATDGVGEGSKASERVSPRRYCLCDSSSLFCSVLVVLRHP